MKNEIEGYKIRKWYEFFEETFFNQYDEPKEKVPLCKFVVGVVIHNPYAGNFSKDLNLLIEPSKSLGEEFGKRLIKVSNNNPIVSYGKSCMVGTNGEYEHGNACLTTEFANPLREIIGGGLAWVPSTGKICGTGTEIDIPLAHKDAIYVRSHYDTFTISIKDAPRPDEIVILFAAASRGRLNARLGGLTEDEIIGKDGLK